jgi:hypothetical protein
MVGLSVGLRKNCILSVFYCIFLIQRANVCIGMHTKAKRVKLHFLIIFLRTRSSLCGTGERM